MKKVTTAVSFLAMAGFALYFALILGVIGIVGLVIAAVVKWAWLMVNT